MEYRTLGRSGLRVSQLGLGCGSATFAGKADDADALAIISEAVELGITYFDTAETYAEGRSERLLGKALSKVRSDVVIGTKFGKDRSVSVGEQPGSRRRVIRAVEGSLERLASDYIDLFILHEPDPDTPIEETLGALDDVVRAGKVRYIGCAGFAAWELCTALWTSKERLLQSFVSMGARYNLLDRGVEREAAPCCMAYGVSVVPTAPLASGFLTGKYARGKHAPAGSRFAASPVFAGPKHQDLSRYNGRLSPANFARLEAWTAFADRRDRTVGQLAIAWLSSRPWVDVVPVGVSSIGQLRQNIKDFGWIMSPGELNALDAIGTEIV